MCGCISAQIYHKNHMAASEGAFSEASLIHKSSPFLIYMRTLGVPSSCDCLHSVLVGVEEFFKSTVCSLLIIIAHCWLNVQVTLIKAMIRSGANPNAQDAGGLTAAMHASRMGNPAVIVMLIQEANIDVSLRDNNGQTALDLAADQPTIDTLTKDSIFLRAHGRQFI